MNAEALVPLAIAAPAALACPGMMLWRARRGERAACCAPQPDIDALRARQEQLLREIAALEDADTRVSSVSANPSF